MKKRLNFIAAVLWVQAAGAATIPNVPPLVSNSAFANVMLDMSVETPMGGAAYADQKDNPPGCSGRSNHGGGSVGDCYFSSYEYLGLFDPDKCYNYKNGKFVPTNPASNHRCSGQWSGNFLNWASMTAIDIFIWTMTGGNRVVDAKRTVLERARAHINRSWYPIKYLANPSGAAPFGGSIFITNYNAGGYSFKVGSTRGGDEHGTYNVKVRVCNPNKGLEKNCKAYTWTDGSTIYKPEGLIQRYADKMRFGVFAYTNDNDQSRDGGVLRAPMAYVGEKEMDNSGNLGANTRPEVDSSTGQFHSNPLGDSSGNSGIINYINKFHKDGYKAYDPIGEMYYEVIRYFKNIGRTPEYADGAPGGSFPVYKNWNDPIQFHCQKNFVVAINDSNPWLDKRLPGTFFTCDKAATVGMPTTFKAGDCGQPSHADSSINVAALTQQVGQMEGLHTNWQSNDSTGADGVGYVAGVSTGAGQCATAKTVSDLGKVMGTCPYPPKENAYYVAGLAYYANTTDLRPSMGGDQRLNNFFIDTREYNLNPLSGNRNMLYLAGKYGGFTDLNGNGQPDLQAEWDADGDGEPDNFVEVTSPDKLVLGLERAFKNVLDKAGSLSNVTANSTQISTDTLVFQATFNSGNWTGDLLAYQVTSSGVASSASWQATSQLPQESSRNIFINTGGSVESFEWSNLSSGDQALLVSSDVVDYLRGDRSNELSNGGNFRNRGSHVLGDIIHSSPNFIKDSNTVFIGANDGMLHAFDVANGQELFAYIPSAVIPNLKRLSESSYSHNYFVDGDIAVSDNTQTTGHNHLVSLLGRGGKGLFALDVTSPSSFGGNDLLWEYFDGTDNDLGYMLGSPTIAKLNNGTTAVIVGNGYSSISGESALYIFDLATGTLIKKIKTGASGDNGLSSPTVLDSDNDGDVDFVYAGDLKGNVWKFDLNHHNTNQWTVDSLFAAQDAGGNSQPITGPLTLAYNTVTGSPNNGKLYVFFGTGSYVFATDPADTQTQTWYALIDDGTPPSGRSDLKERGFSSSGTTSGFDVRTFDTAVSGDMSGKKGWYIDLSAGERMVTGSGIYNLIVPVLVGASIIPEINPCSAGGSGFINLINPFTGGSVSEVIVDINTDDEFDNSDKLGDEIIGSIDPNIGMPGAPVLVGNRLIVGGSTGQITSFNVNLGSSTIGRLMWREIITE